MASREAYKAMGPEEQRAETERTMSDRERFDAMSAADKRKAAVEAGVGRGLYAFEAENVKKLRTLRLDNLGHVVEFTGKNGQGKTSALDAFWFLLKGKAALPPKPLRSGAERLMVKGDFGAFTVTRTKGDEGTLPTLNLQMARGKTAWDTPQAMLDGIVGELSFDPLAFIRMTPKEQVETLRKAVILDVDIDDLNNANELDYAERTLVNNRVKALKAQIDAMTPPLEGLPKEKLDEQAILKQLDQAGEDNRQAQEIFKTRQLLGAEAGRARAEFEANERFVESETHRIGELERQLKLAKDALKAAQIESKRLGGELLEAEKAYEAAPSGELVDVAAISLELQNTQRTNRAIDHRQVWDKLKDDLKAEQAEADKITHRMGAREEKKRKALAGARMPVDGIRMDETKVTFEGIPLENLGEGEAIGISTRIGMALNPVLRVMRIPHGEALDEDGMKLIAGLAREHDYQVWISRVDSSGKIGIVMVDGEVAARNEAE